MVTPGNRYIKVPLEIKKVQSPEGNRNLKAVISYKNLY